MDRPASKAAVVAVPAAGALAATAALFWAGRDGWKGAPNECIARGDCYCEALRPGLIHQPANTWSALAFLAVAAAVAVHAATRGRSDGQNPMQREAYFPAKFALLVALIGPGTMGLHATTTSWGGALDSISMYLLGVFIIVYAAHRFGKLSRSAVPAAWTALAAPLAASKWLQWMGTEVTFGAILSVGCLAEVWLCRARSRPVGWLAASAGLFLLAFGLWWFSHTGGPLCVPESLWQGHAAWHVLTALSAGALYLHYWHEPKAGGQTPDLRERKSGV